MDIAIFTKNTKAITTLTLNRAYPVRRITNSGVCILNNSNCIKTYHAKNFEVMSYEEFDNKVKNYIVEFGDNEYIVNINYGPNRNVVKYLNVGCIDQIPTSRTHISTYLNYKVFAKGVTLANGNTIDVTILPQSTQIISTICVAPSIISCGIRQYGNIDIWYSSFKSIVNRLGYFKGLSKLNKIYYDSCRKHSMDSFKYIVKNTTPSMGIYSTNINNTEQIQYFSEISDVVTDSHLNENSKNHIKLFMMNN